MKQIKALIKKARILYPHSKTARKEYVKTALAMEALL